MQQTSAAQEGLQRLASRNVVFNLLGRAGNALLIFVFVPLIVALAGPESWGLVGFAISLTAITSILDIGLGATLSREIARFTADPERRNRRGDLVFSYELPVAVIALLVAAVMYLLAGPIVTRWLQGGELPASTISYCLHLLAPALGLQLLVTLYTGALVGLQRQWLTNWARLSYTGTLYGGSILLMWLDDEAGIQRFFQWQLVCSAAYGISLRTTLYRFLGQDQRRRWTLGYLLEGRKFALGMAGTTLLVIALTQGDKLLLSRLLSLETYGIYILAGTLTSIQMLLVQPVHTAIYPQLTAMLSSEDSSAAQTTFLYWSRRVSAIALPLGALLCLFPATLAALWLNDPVIAQSMATPAALLAMGSLLNALNTLPYTLQLAAGWASLGFYSNLIAVCLMVPGLLYLTPRWGMSGAAFIWLLLNTGYLLIQTPVMFRRLLPQCRATWYRDAIFAPSLISFLLLGIAFVLDAAMDFDTLASIATALSAMLLAVGANISYLTRVEGLERA